MTTIATTSGILDHFVQHARGIYSLPAVAMKVIELTNQPDVDAQQLKSCIENDPALVAKILRVANGSIFGLSRRVSDLNQALALLGTKPLKLLVLGFSLPTKLFDGVEASVIERFWRHTLIRAVAAREISEQIFETPGDDAFIAGLLQDIGMLALIQQLGESYITFLGEVFAEGGNLPELEVETLGFDHMVFSARMLDQWGLPDSLIIAIGAPHDVQKILALEPENRTIAQIVHLADLVAELFTQQRSETRDRLLEASQAYCSVSLEPFYSLAEQLGSKVQELADVLSLNLPDDIDYAQVLAQAHLQMAELAEGVSGHIADRPAAKSANAQRLQETVHAVGQGQTAFLSPPTPAMGRNPARASQASTDDPGLQGRISAAVQSCRQARCGMTLLFVKLDQYDEFVVNRSLDGAEQYLQILELSFDSVFEPSDARLHVGDARFAVLIEDCDRNQALDAAHHLIRELDNEVKRRVASGGSLSVSIGIASLSLPPKNFPPEELITAADRCLHAASSMGGNCVKSIDIF